MYREMRRIDTRIVSRGKVSMSDDLLFILIGPYYLDKSLHLAKQGHEIHETCLSVKLNSVKILNFLMIEGNQI